MPPVPPVGGRVRAISARTVCQTRVLELAGGGSIGGDRGQGRRAALREMRHHRLQRSVGRALANIDGESHFAPAGTGYRITLHYNLLRCSRPTESTLAAFGWFLRGYACQMLNKCQIGSLTDRQIHSRSPMGNLKRPYRYAQCESPECDVYAFVIINNLVL
jgi:hypothetical protein